MPIFLLVFEFLGTSELMVIALVALIVFGPRKLPEIGRMLGKSLAEFKRASDDFKRTWEYEVELDSKKPVPPAGQESRVGSDVLTEGNETRAGVEAFAEGGVKARDDGQAIARTSFGAAHGPGYEPEKAAEGSQAFENRDAESADELNAS